MRAWEAREGCLLDSLTNGAMLLPHRIVVRFSSLKDSFWLVNSRGRLHHMKIHVILPRTYINSCSFPRALFYELERARDL